MRVRVLAGISLAALVIATPALAADIAARPIYKAPPMVPVAYNWSGFYVGINAGYGFGGSSNVLTTGRDPATVASITGGARPGTVSLDRSGFLGGGQIGYNWQFGSIVAGVEADIAYTGFGDSATFTSGALSSTFRQNLDYLGTARGRLGYAWDRTLIYATGGLAYGGVNNRVDFFGPAGQLSFTGRDDSIKTGYTVGGGIEQALGGGWSAKVEYLYYNLGHDNVSVAAVPGGGGVGVGYNTRFEEDGHLVRAGLNYKFNGL
jgi:outer membrane immunogenic protein